MKRYIRTEDGVYDLETKNNDDEFENQIADIEEISYGGKNGSCVLIPQKCILAEADTIEELCDGFVTEGNKHIVWDKAQLKGLTFGQVKFAFANGDFEIYGAIWTPKGLIYVAKMNDKRELVLI